MPEQPKTSPLAEAAGVPRADEYFGPWAIEPGRGMAMLEWVRSMDLAAHIETTSKPNPSAGLKGFRLINLDLLLATGGGSTDDSVDDDAADAGPMIAVIPILGTLMKQQSSLDQSTSYVMLRKMIRDARENPLCLGAIFHVDSPGGSVAGCAEAVAEIEAFAAVKPCIAFVADFCASAAYRLACVTDEVYANTSEALVGSIGTLICIYDSSGAAEKAGIQAKVYATGDIKGAGIPGTKITEQQDAYFQGIVDDSQPFFTADVMRGREMTAEQVGAVATGAVFMAGAAQESGLIDGIKNFDECVARMGELITQRAAVAAGVRIAAETQKENLMSTTPAADGKKFVEAFGQQGAVWYVEGKSFEDATALHNKQVSEQLAAAVAERDALRAKVADLEARVTELRGAANPVSASLPAEEKSAAASKDVNALENKIGKNLGAVARSIKLPQGK